MDAVVLSLKTWTKAFLNLFFPELCEVCGAMLVHQEKLLCTECLLELPRTGYHLLPDNPVEKLFWGRVRIERASAFFRYSKGSSYHHILHKLKYSGKKEIGLEMGRLFAYTLQGTDFQQTDFIVPVPLHPKKEKKRGYNQSFWIALGLSEILQVPVDSTSIIRVQDSSTQTRKNRIERWENVQDIFDVIHPEVLDGKRIILVDDVITTGATLEGLILCVQKKVNCKIYLLSLAIA